MIWKKIYFQKKLNQYILAYDDTPRAPMGSHKKFQPFRSSRLAGYREHIPTGILTHFPKGALSITLQVTSKKNIYESLVLLYG